MISLINYFIMKKRINKIKVPQFPKKEITRKRFTFEGRVKKVGFRNEILLISRHLGVSGFVYNTKFGVIAEIEGKSDQLAFIIEHLESIDRFIINNISSEKIALKKEKKFYKK